MERRIEAQLRAMLTDSFKGLVAAEQLLSLLRRTTKRTGFLKNTVLLGPPATDRATRIARTCTALRRCMGLQSIYWD